MYTDVVTVFNKKHGGEVWYPHILRNVTLHKARGTSQRKDGPESTDSARLLIKYRMEDGRLVIGDTEYLPPKTWENSAGEAVTFREGIDFFAEGEYGTEPVSEERYRDGFYHFMKTTEDGVFLITGVSGPFRLIPHFEIGGR